MFLDRINIESHGPLSRIALGPFSQTLTAIIAAGGSGKTALVRFLRDSLTGTTPARDGLTHSQGRVTWTAADGYYHCHREPNGTREGRRFVEFESRLVDAFDNDRLAREAIVVDLPACVVDGIVTDTAQTRVANCVQAAIASGLARSGATDDNQREIEINELRREIAELERQIHSHTLHSQHATALPTGSYDSFGLTLDMKRLRDRRAELALEISAIDARRDWATKADAEMDRRRRKRDLFATIADDIARLRRHESDLRMKLSEAESSLEKMDEDANRADTRASIAKAYRQRLEQVDTQLSRVRSIVREIRSLGDHWFGGRGLTAQSGWLDQTIDGVSRQSDEYNLLNQVSELDIVDRGWATPLVDEMRVDETRAASAEDIQRRIDAICRMVDNLVGRCEEHQEQSVAPERSLSPSRLTDWDAWAEAELDRNERRRHPGRNANDWSRPTSPSQLSGMPTDPAEGGERFEPTRGLDRAERLLQEERTYRGESLSQSGENIAWIAGVLNGISQRLRGLAGRRAAYGASNTDPLFHTRRDDNVFTDPSNFGASLDPQATMSAVRRCEREVVDVLRQLSSRREVMLRRIAEVQNQPLSRIASTIGDAQAINDDPQLYQWLVRDRIVASEAEAKHRESALRRVKQQQSEIAADLKQTGERILDRVAEAETIRVYLRSLPVVHRYDDDAALRTRLVAGIQAIDEQLSRPRVHPTVLQRHAQCVARLRSLNTIGFPTSGLAAAASEYLQKLSAGQLRSVAWHGGMTTAKTSHVEIDGRNEITCTPAERFIAAIAVRLAASDELARRGRALPIIIETPSQRHGTSDLRSFSQHCVDTLVAFARRGRQVIVLTDDGVVADSIARVGGAMMSLSGGRERTVIESMQHNQSLHRMYDVNTDFDLAWREANGDETIFRNEEYRQTPATELGRDDTSRFDQVAQRGEASFATSSASSVPQGRAEAIDTPFFLTLHSFVDQAPSINAAQANRLREVGVQRIEHLLAASPKELAHSLRIDDVDVATVRRWQHECRLVCGVKKLRPFDARVLVGCGITHPRELAELDPASMVEQVETFLATPRGEALRRSGSSQEIARLNDWLRQARSQSSRQTTTSSASSTRSSSPRATTEQRSSSNEKKAPSRFSEARRQRETRPERETTSRERSGDRSEQTVLKFYLERASDVEAAPSIGPRMAERLYAIGVNTVDDLTSRSASSIADTLGLSKVDASLVTKWQQQATLVCRVPNLRGHDAQLLLAADITDAESLSRCEATSLLKKINVVVNSREGQSILRGGKLPDLAEMHEWISSAQHHRELVTA